jgi:hypothetical protein
MYLSEYDDGTLGFKKLKKLAKKVAKPVLKVQAKVQKAALKITPKPLKSVVKKVQASERRMTESILTPFETKRLLKEEAQQIKKVAKSKDVRKIAAGLIAAAAIYFTGGAATPAVLSALKAAADRAAAKKAAAQTAAEEAAAQAEFEQYARMLAEQSKAQPADAFPPAVDELPAPAYPEPMARPAVMPRSTPVIRTLPDSSESAVVRSAEFETESKPSMLSQMPSWLPWALAGGAALLLIPALSRRS